MRNHSSDLSNSSTPESSILLSVQHLSVALPTGGDRPYAVRDVHFELNKNEILCIVGESGSGKSISANAIMGLLPTYLKPKSGRILFRGQPVDLKAAARNNIADVVVFGRSLPDRECLERCTGRVVLRRQNLLAFRAAGVTAGIAR